MMVLDIPGGTQAQYEQISLKLSNGRGLRKSSDWPVPGLVSHASGPTESGWCVVDVWESEQAWTRFANVMVPLSQEVGMPQLTPRLYPTVNVVRD
ncbi:hypothetical protein [Streptomyces fructofermentans]|nr:hypothetical protein [Streptomyces fructofermentans]